MRSIRWVFTVASVLATSAVACDKSLLAPPQALSEADVVFRGKVENLRYLDSPEKTKTEPRIIVTFTPLKVWKGKAENSVVIHTTHNKGSCNGYAFKAGHEYLVYAKFNKRADGFFSKLFAPESPTLGIKFYGGTKAIEAAGKDLEYLEKQ